MDGSKIKTYSIVGTGVVVTTTMIFLAMALAQRDARTQDSTAILQGAPFPTQTAEGISHDPNASQENWPPQPVIRSNDSELGDTLPEVVSPENSLRPQASLIAYNSASSSPPPALAEPPAIGNLPPLPSTFDEGSPIGTPAPLPPGPLPISNGSLPPAPSFPAIPTPADAIETDAEPSAPESLENSLPSLPTGPSFPSDLAPSPFAPPASSRTAPQPSLPEPMPAAPISREPNSGAAGSLGDGFRGTSSPPIAGSGSGPAAARLQPPTLTDAPPPSISEPTTPPPAFPSRPATQPAPVANGVPSNSVGATPVSTSAGAGFASPAPGVRHLEGSQNPSMEIQKRAPSEVQVGIPATFTILVRNVGTATAYDVAVHDAIPKGATLIRTNPSAQVDPQGKLLWKLGEMAAGSEQVLTLDVTPEAEGELGSVASVTFAAQASVRTMSTKPELVVKQTSAESVLGGDSVSITIEVSNVGTGTARNVELEEDVPSNMRHSSGVSTLGLTIGDLAPGESERVVIDLTAVAAGQAVNRIRAISSNNARYESTATIDVVQPKLAIEIEGPRLRYLERQATYRASISNTGTAMARDIELLLYLPRGLEYTSAANEGTYLRDQHAVAWSLAELSAGATVTTEVTLLPVQEGEFVVRMQCSAEGIQAEPIDKKVQVEGQSELAFSIEDDNDPIETDGLTTYIVRVNNSGTRVDTNVQLVLEVPDGAQVEQVHAPVNYQVSQRTIVFSPIPSMPPKDQQTYRVSVRHNREGTLVARAQLKSGNRPVPVIKEESTHVYRDN